MVKKQFKPAAIVGRTYNIDGKVMTEEQALALPRSDGERRFKHLHESVGDLPGTLVCTSNPLTRVRSIEEEMAAVEHRRKSEGHFGRREATFHLKVSPAAAGSGYGSREAN